MLARLSFISSKCDDNFSNFGILLLRPFDSYLHAGIFFLFTLLLTPSTLFSPALLKSRHPWIFSPFFLLPSHSAFSFLHRLLFIHVFSLPSSNADHCPFTTLPFVSLSCSWENEAKVWACRAALEMSWSCPCTKSVFLWTVSSAPAFSYLRDLCSSFLICGLLFLKTNLHATTYSHCYNRRATQRGEIWSGLTENTQQDCSQEFNLRQRQFYGLRWVSFPQQTQGCCARTPSIWTLDYSNFPCVTNSTHQSFHHFTSRLTC